ncbi:hypothetical protein AX17_001546 [Amanita inopinata Kibby_2008]|nr:hypothetical protein AX17_001546 [Amanita inopinata Kibby_2008]
MDEDQPAAERLEVEDDGQRQKRIQLQLERLNALSSSKSHTSSQKFDFGDRTTYPIAPPTELLARIQAFLPQIEASNVTLAQQAQQHPESVDIEHVSEDVEQYIEMNLGLGVFEDRSQRMQGKKDAEMSSPSPSSPSSSSPHTSRRLSSESSSAGELADGRDGDDEDEDEDEADSSDADTDSSSEIITSFSLAPRIIRPLPKRSLASRLKPNIVVLSDQASGEVPPSAV